MRSINKPSSSTDFTVDFLYFIIKTAETGEFVVGSDLFERLNLTENIIGELKKLFIEIARLFNPLFYSLVFQLLNFLQACIDKISYLKTPYSSN